MCCLDRGLLLVQDKMTAICFEKTVTLLLLFKYFFRFLMMKERM